MREPLSKSVRSGNYYNSPAAAELQVFHIQTGSRHSYGLFEVLKGHYGKFMHVEGVMCIGKKMGKGCVLKGRVCSMLRLGNVRQNKIRYDRKDILQEGIKVR